MNRRLVFWEAVATLVGTVIGAGILGIPYIIAKAGFWTGIADIVFIGLAVMLLYLYLGEVALRTKGIHQLTGYAEIYLGKTGKFLMMLSMVLGIYGALIAYMIGVGQALAAIFGGNPLIFSIGFFAVASVIVYLGLRQVAQSELVMLPLMIIAVITVSILSIKHINIANYTSFNVFNIFVPYGVVLFAFLGSTAIPEMEMELVRNEKYMKKAIMLGMLIPMVIYLIFPIAVVGVTGISTTEVASIGLGKAMGEYMVIIGNIFAILTMSTSFLALGLALKQMYNYDYKISKKISWALTCIIPLIIVLASVTSFVKILDVSGILTGGLTGILIVLMALNAKKMGDRHPEYTIPINKFIAGLYILLFAGGAVYFLIQTI